MKKTIVMVIPLFFVFSTYWVFAGITAPNVQVQVLRSVSTSTYPYQLLRLSNSQNLETYAMWIPPKPGIRSVVVFTEPYAGIDWTGLPLDLAASTMPGASQNLIEDVYGPMYEAGKSQKIFYQFKTPDAVVAEATPFTINGMGALFVFERFYAGKPVGVSFDETALGIEFLVTQPAVDANKIGIYGASWGGLEALHGAAHAKAGMKPSYGVAWQPMVNLGRFWNDVTRDYYTRFQSNPSSQTMAYQKLEPYSRRVAVSAWSTTTQSMDFSKLGIDYLKNNLKTEFLILHDDWDTIAPKEHTLDITSAMATGTISSFIVPRGTPIDYSTFTIDHFPVKAVPNFDNWGAVSFGYAYLIDRLAPSTAPYWISFYDSNEFGALLIHLQKMKTQGKIISSINPRLIDLANPKLKLYDVSGAIIGAVDGSYVVSEYINAVFGLKTSSSTVIAYLTNNSL